MWWDNVQIEGMNLTARVSVNSKRINTDIAWAGVLYDFIIPIPTRKKLFYGCLCDDSFGCQSFGVVLTPVI